MSNAKFTVKWQAEDGYVSGTRPQAFEIDADDFHGMSETEIEEAVNEILQEEFVKRVTPGITNFEALMQWIKSIAKAEGGAA